MLRQSLFKDAGLWMKSLMEVVQMNISMKAKESEKIA